MERRELLALLGAGAAGLMAGGAALADDDDKKGDDKWKERREHVRIVGECAVVCNAVAAHCLQEMAKEDCKDRGHLAKVGRAAGDCETFCAQGVILMTRRSPMVMYNHKACADACRDCAAECEKSSRDLITICAKHCRECERFCREHSGASV